MRATQVSRRENIQTSGDCGVRVNEMTSAPERPPLDGFPMYVRVQALVGDPPARVVAALAQGERRLVPHWAGQGGGRPRERGKPRCGSAKAAGQAEMERLPQPVGISASRKIPPRAVFSSHLPLQPSWATSWAAESCTCPLTTAHSKQTLKIGGRTRQTRGDAKLSPRNQASQPGELLRK